MFVFPHGATVDRDGNLWVTDARGENGKGHQVFKFSPDGKVLMTLGKAGVSGSGPDLFDQPTDVVVAPNGDIFVTDSHRNGKNNRVVRFTQGRQVREGVGQEGIGPRRDQRAAHHRASIRAAGCSSAIARTTASRSSIRTASYIAEWRQFGRPSGIAITADDTIYVADSESGPDTGAHELPGHQEGHPHRQREGRLGHARSSRTWSRRAADHSGAEGVGVDAQGNVYGAVVRRQMLERHVRNRG